MRRALFCFVSLAAIFAAGCGPKYKDGKCENSEHCKDQTGYGKVCVQGMCQECGGDTDCKAGFVCKANKCEPRPECEGPADCAAGKTCEAGKCVAAAATECGPDRACPANQDCMGGRCIAKSATAPAASGACDQLASVTFGFDEATLSGDARAKLEQSAKCLKDSGAKGVTVEGNCDERGTAEYNMHLGQRRADAVKKYLGGLGVPAKGISAVSFGKEKPSCTEATEDCWARNRRADLKAK
jgi:peptidoglycan-associated lipoprotein